MGFTIDPDHFKLVFADERFARPAGGDPIEVVLEELGIGEMLDFDEARLRPVSTVAEAREQWAAVAETVAAHLVSWNLERKGEPVPLSAAGFMSLPRKLGGAIVSAWIDANIGVSGPLETGSPSGEPFPEGSLPMEPLSPNPES